MKKAITLITAIIVLIAAAIPIASAEDSATSTLTITETQINDSFTVTNPINRRVSDVSVDLQSANGGQIVLSATYTWRTRAGVQTRDVVEIVAPTVTNGRVYWNVVSVTSNGQPAASDLVNQINEHLDASWHRWISEQAPAGVVTAVTITDSDITYSY